MMVPRKLMSPRVFHKLGQQNLPGSLNHRVKTPQLPFFRLLQLCPAFLPLVTYTKESHSLTSAAASIFTLLPQATLILCDFVTATNLDHRGHHPHPWGVTIVPYHRR
jgi:hypothetical protein